MRRVRRVVSKSQSPAAEPPPLGPAATALAIIQALIPLGLRAVEERLIAEVAALAGPRYTREEGRPGLVRWGQQPGSVYLADQKLPLSVPRVRDLAAGCEVPLPTYRALQVPRADDTGLYRRVLAGIAGRDYAAAAEAVPDAFGLSKSSVSRRFIRASARALRPLQERPLGDREWLALVLDGKTFGGDQLVLALGVTRTGEKVLLGLVQTATENKAVCARFLRSLGERGFPLDAALLVVLDGAKGLRAAVHDALPRAVIQRCQWHKRENVVRYLPKAQQASWRRKLQTAYDQSTHAQAQAALGRLARELRLLNASAAASLDEGLEETLTLHRLGVFRELGTSFRTTNLIESVNARVEARSRRVTHWRTSDQKQRWCAAALLDMERQFRRVKGHAQLPLLYRALQATIPHAIDDEA